MSLKVREPQFEGQTKTKLGNSEVRGIVDNMVTEALTEYFEENAPVAKKSWKKPSWPAGHDLQPEKQGT